MSFEAPRTQEQIIRAFEQQEIESNAYWNAFDTPSFFRKIGVSWSPAESVRHLTKSTRPVVLALELPRIALRLMFGRPRRASLSYDDVCDRYLQGLRDGGQAGRFAPAPRHDVDVDASRLAIMAGFAAVNRELRTMIGRWPEESLDRIQLPHPFLGKLTVREMLLFTLYHQRHHIAVVGRRLAEAGLP